MLVALKTAFLRAHLNQYEVARQIGRSETRVSRIVQGRLEATDTEKRAFARLLNAPISELFPTAATVTARPHGR
jgi:transcriptional regulator with XRE-family HTH domain